MIWPTQRLVLLALIPGLGSLALLLPGSSNWGTSLLGLDLAIALLALGDALTLWGAGKIQARRTVAGVASLGEPLNLELEVSNPTRRRWRIRVRDELPPSFELDHADFTAILEPGRAALFRTRAVPKQRGAFPLERVDFWVWSLLGLWRRSLHKQCASLVRVYPDVRQIARYTMLARRDRLSVIGLRRSRRLGTDNEFERLRDYREGDEPRHIDWRATARRSKLTVRAHQTNQSQRIIFVIDSGRMMAGDTGGGLSPLDRAFNAMLLLAHVALVRGDQVGLIVYADSVRAFVPPIGGPRRINRLVHAVHDLFPLLVESRHERAFVELEKRCRKRSLVVLMTNLFDEVGAGGVRVHLANLVGRHLPMAVLIRDRELFDLADRARSDPTLLYRGAAAASILNWRERVIAELRQEGSLVLDVFTEDLTARLVNRYLEIKARHLL